jgi:hypothetical protein
VRDPRATVLVVDPWPEEPQPATVMATAAIDATTVARQNIATA